ncbi:FAD-dependent monooxygenase [Actinoallomurus purpureus]|uniref:FAD-dependent monooxygenase n=1 Tax=Actinoallomurus purpureus TaxID=478114 RepID=UPI00209321F5|nr:FAD-dependent monooxygenase [Actinoallomurus purpureus]MCO6007579.1 FAD-dependent monooxygenase [Actinoallomurus purpureus]
MHETETYVLIAGAGPTGLTLACDLARRGVGFRIVDREPYTGSRAAPAAAPISGYAWRDEHRSPASPAPPAPRGTPA